MLMQALHDPCADAAEALAVNASIANADKENSRRRKRIRRTRRK